jgi:hypothetical protein
VRVLASPEAVAFVRGAGGVLFVWVERLRTQGSVRYIEASTESPGPERRFTRLVGREFELLLDTGGLELPDRLEIELRGRRRKRVRVLWNGATFPSNPRIWTDG